MRETMCKPNCSWMFFPMAPPATACSVLDCRSMNWGMSIPTCRLTACDGWLAGCQQQWFGSISTHTVLYCVPFWIYLIDFDKAYQTWKLIDNDVDTQHFDGKFPDLQPLSIEWLILARLGSISLPNTQHGIGIWVCPDMGGHTKPRHFHGKARSIKIPITKIHQNQPQSPKNPSKTHQTIPPSVPYFGAHHLSPCPPLDLTHEGGPIGSRQQQLRARRRSGQAEAQGAADLAESGWILRIFGVSENSGT